MYHSNNIQDLLSFLQASNKLFTFKICAKVACKNEVEVINQLKVTETKVR